MNDFCKQEVYLPKVIVIIVTFNGLKYIASCIENIKKSSYPIDVVIVDNASNDGTPEFIERNYPEYILFRLRENIGFGKANNIGIKWALNNGCEFVFLLNQDVYVEEKTIEELVSVHKNFPQYGILSPIQLNGQGSLDVQFAYYISVQNDYEILSDLVLSKELKQVYDVSFVNAAIWTISRRCLETVGLFNPIFFLYGEDDNYIYRCFYHKFKVGIVPRSYGIHDRNQIVHEDEIMDFKKVLSKNNAWILSTLCNINDKFISAFIDVMKSFLKLAIIGIVSGNSRKIILAFNMPCTVFRQLIPIMKSRKESRNSGAFMSLKS
jgi:GT2 family glycosyltransferase